VSEDCADTLGNKPGVPFGYKHSISGSGSMVFGDHRTGSAEQPIL
jgi:hypothetical protein